MWHLRILIGLLGLALTGWLNSGCSHRPAVVKTVEASPVTEESQEKLDTLN